MRRVGTNIYFVMITVLCIPAWSQNQQRATASAEYMSLCMASFSRSGNKYDTTETSRTADATAQRGRYDFAVIQSADAKVRSKFDASFSDTDVRVVECRAWQEYRRQHPNEPLDLDRFAAYAAANYGGLKVRSTPEGAAIIIDNTPWEGPTDAQNMCSVGTRHVTLKKEGYWDESGDAIVKEGEWTVFERTLKAKQ